MARGSTNHFRLVLCYHPHQSSTRPHTLLRTRSTHSPSKEFRFPPTQSPSRVQTQITNSLSRAQARFAPQGFWSSGPRAFSHPGFCGLMLHIVHYHIPGLYLTPYWIFGFTLHIFSDTTRPSICSYHVRGSILRISFYFLFFVFFFVFFFFFFFSFFFRRLATCLCHVVLLHQ